MMKTMNSIYIRQQDFLFPHIPESAKAPPQKDISWQFWNPDLHFSSATVYHAQLYDTVADIVLSRAKQVPVLWKMVRWLW